MCVEVSSGTTLLYLSGPWAPPDPWRNMVRAPHIGPFRTQPHPSQPGAHSVHAQAPAVFRVHAGCCLLGGPEAPGNRHDSPWAGGLLVNSHEEASRESCLATPFIWDNWSSPTDKQPELEAASCQRLPGYQRPRGAPPSPFLGGASWASQPHCGCLAGLQACPLHLPTAFWRETLERPLPTPCPTGLGYFKPGN